MSTVVAPDTCAQLVFDRLSDIWSDALKSSGWLYNDYWKAGNTLDAAINYFVASKQKDENNFVKRSYDAIFKPRFGDPNIWLDDYGWWGNAFANAYKNADALGISTTDRTTYLNAAKDCWGKLRESAEKSLAYGSGLPLDQQIKGGAYCAWNGGNAKDYFTSGPNPDLNYNATPNTVTNAGFLALSWALFDLGGAESGKYFSAIQSNLAWFKFAFEYKPQNGDFLPNALLNDYFLARETPHPWSHLYWCYDLDRAWSADQGSLLYCLSRAKKSNIPIAVSALLNSMLRGYEVVTITKISDGTKRYHLRSRNSLLASPPESESADGPLYFWEFPTRPVPTWQDENSSNYNNNYCTGPGVFMRYLTRTDLAGALDKQLAGAISMAVKDSADAAWEHRDEQSNQIQYWYGRIEESPYATYYEHGDKNLWNFALQASALDLFVAWMHFADSRS